MFGVGLVCAKVVLVPLLFDQPADLPFTVPKALVSHALAYALVGVVIGLVVRFRWAVLVRSWLHVPILAFLAASVIGTLLAADPLLALFGSHDRMVGLATIADGAVLYFGIALLVRTRAEATAVFVAALGASVLVIGYELLQFAGRDPFSWNIDASVRPFSTIGQTTQLAEYLGVAAVGAAALALFDGNRRRAVRGALGGYALLALAGMTLTQTRAAVLGLVLASAALVVFTLVGHPNRRARILSLGGAIAAAGVFALVLFFTPLGSRLLSTVEVSTTAEGESGPHLEQSVDVHLAHYAIAFGMFLDRPVFGYGPDNFLVGVPRYRTADEPFELQQSPSSSAHGWVAQVAATGGLTGLATFVAIPLVGIWLTWRAGFRAAAWAAAAMMVAYLGAAATTVNGVGTDWLFWATVGAMAVATAEPAPDVTPAVRRPRSTYSAVEPRTRRLVSFGVAVLAVLFALTIIGGIDASRSARASQVARLEGRTTTAIAQGLHATQADSLRPQYWDTLGLAYVSAGRFKDAASAFEEANHLAPYDVRYVGDVARAYAVLVQRGDSAASARARDAAERAVQIDRNNPQAHLTRAVVMQVTGDQAEALKSVERALALDTSFTNAQLDLTATQVLNANGRTNDAIATARRAIATVSLQDSVQIRVELARALVAAGQPAQALSELDAALAIRPNDAAALQLRAQIRAGTTQ